MYGWSLAFDSLRWLCGLDLLRRSEVSSDAFLLFFSRGDKPQGITRAIRGPWALPLEAQSTLPATSTALKKQGSLLQNGFRLFLESIFTRNVTAKKLVEPVVFLGLVWAQPALRGMLAKWDWVEYGGLARSRANSRIHGGSIIPTGAGCCS